MYKPVGWEDAARSPSLRRIRKERSARDVSSTGAAVANSECEKQHESTHARDEEGTVVTKTTTTNADGSKTVEEVTETPLVQAVVDEKV